MRKKDGERMKPNEVKFVTALELLDEEHHPLITKRELREYRCLKAYVADVLDLRVI
jgi:hypothetical protein